MGIIGAPLQGRAIVLHHRDPTETVTLDRVKAVFWTAGNTVLTIARFPSGSEEHYYVHWPRERFVWFEDVPEKKP